jgi:WD40 repeat protein
MNRAPGRFRRAASGIAVATAFLAFASLAGCQTKDSLVLVTVSAQDNTTTGLRTLVVKCGSTTQVFHLSSDISTNDVTVGLYVPSSTTGRQTVSAQAVSQSGQCGPGYSGTAVVNIGSAGATVSTTITMISATTCPPMTGTTGTGGSNGTGGTNGCTAQAPPAAGTPPAFACCIEYDQDTPELCSASSSASYVEIDSVAFSPDGKTFVSAEGSAGNNVKVWSFDGHTLTPKTVLPSDGWWSMAFSADGSLLAVAVTGGVDLWNTSTWTLKTTLLGSSNFFVGVAFTPDQTHIIALDQNSAATLGTLYVFDLNAATSQIPIKTLTLTDGPEDLAVARKAVNGQVGVAVSYSDGFADVFSYANGTFSTPVNVVVDSTGFNAWLPAFSADGTLLAIGDDDGFVHFWNFPLSGPTESGTELAFGTAGNGDAVFAVDFSPNGSYLAAGGGSSGDSDSNAAVFNVASRSQRARANSSYNVTAIAFSPLGNAVGGGEGDCGRVFMCTN